LSSLGILGGTFNPPHVGHLELARHAQAQLGLERVLLVPAYTSPFKLDSERNSDPGPEHRLRMCQLAVAGESAVSLCAVEIERGGVSYTVDTLRALHASHPQAQLTLIVGADIAGTLGSWREPSQLLQLAHVAVAERPGAARAPVLQALSGLGARDTRILEMAPIAVSSSLARSRAAQGASIVELVGPAVAGYIAEHHLYRAGVKAVS
jgi:nicotinate-nucleotide adenylyltransferase